jgi:protein-S-isoprenylcysteine O-methyltransferase Ste14
MGRFKPFVKSSTGVAFFLLILFVSAGRADYYQGWIFSAVSVLGLIMNFAFASEEVELLTERSRPPKDAKEWDKHILKLSALITIIAYVVAGLDSGRYHWSPQLPWSICLFGILFVLFGQLVFLWAKKTNKFFSSVVRIQHDRGHTVCDTGIYRFVRHPGYFGMIISWAGFPILLGSVWSAIPTGFAIVLLLIRTHLEDRTLMTELAGYGDYAQRTRFKLVPGIW